VGTQKMADRGPIWSDVSDLITTFDRRWGGVWNVSIRPHPGRGRSGHLWVLCERTVSVGKSGAYKQTRDVGAYPTNDRVSLPALVCELLWRVNQQLEDDSRLAERQASF